ncbi:MAG: hypothetical protein Q7R54_01820 [bacterium]|nr:hypothetical protein [bacterium]
MRALTQRINTYLAVFIIVVVGAGASFMIIRVANADATSFTAQKLGQVN